MDDLNGGSGKSTTPKTTQNRCYQRDSAASDLAATTEGSCVYVATQAYRDWSARVREISRLPKRDLVRRVRDQGVFGDLERWSKDELVSTLCPVLSHEQMWEPADG